MGSAPLPANLFVPGWCDTQEAESGQGFFAAHNLRSRHLGTAHQAAAGQWRSVAGAHECLHREPKGLLIDVETLVQDDVVPTLIPTYFSRLPRIAVLRQDEALRNTLES